MIETLDDIIEELANSFGVYGAHNDVDCPIGHECRMCWVSGIKSRIENAVSVDRRLEATSRFGIDGPIVDDGDRAEWSAHYRAIAEKLYRKHYLAQSWREDIDGFVVKFKVNAYAKKGSPADLAIKAEFQAIDAEVQL